MKERIISYRVIADLETLKNAEFKVVEVARMYTSEQWNVILPQTRVCLERGKKSCYIFLRGYQEVCVEAVANYKKEISEKSLTFEEFLNLPEDIEQGEILENHEKKEIIFSCRLTKNGTEVYVVPEKQYFSKEKAVLIFADDYFSKEENRYYMVYIPETISEAEKLFKIAKTEAVNNTFGRCGGSYWVQTTEPHLEDLLEKLTD